MSMCWPARRIGYLVVVLAVGLVLAGCEKSPVKVTGTVLRDKKPIPVGPTGAVQVILVPDVPPGTEYTTYVARCQPDGKFEILNVKPGKYKIDVEVLDPDPQTDKLNGEFSGDRTPIRRDVDGKKPIEIDLANPNG
jgi:hypothetical protein